jgi:hypothetical protein
MSEPRVLYLGFQESSTIPSGTPSEFEGVKVWYRDDGYIVISNSEQNIVLDGDWSSGTGSAGTLADTLALGNTSGQKNIEMTDGYDIVFGDNSNIVFTSDTNSISTPDTFDSSKPANINIQAGSNNLYEYGTGGDVNITSGNGTHDGGNVYITGGTGETYAGDIVLSGGNNDNDNYNTRGGPISMYGGNGKIGGTINLRSGNGNPYLNYSESGNIYLDGGNTFNYNYPFPRGNILIRAGASYNWKSDAEGYGGDVSINGGFAYSNGPAEKNLKGGNVSIKAGDGSYKSGTNHFVGGIWESANPVNGGDLYLSGGYGYTTPSEIGSGGNVLISSGGMNSYSGNGGDVSIIGESSSGASNVNGGGITLSCGRTTVTNSTGHGGNLILRAGKYHNSDPSPIPGYVLIASGCNHTTNDGYGDIFLFGDVNIDGSLSVNGSPISGGSAGTLADTLALGNTSGVNGIVMTDNSDITLSAGSILTSINDLTLTSGNRIYLSAASGTTGSEIVITGGPGSSNNGGNVSVIGGTSETGTRGGILSITGGEGISTAAGGAANIAGGASVSGTAGQAQLRGGNASGTGTGGAVYIDAGDSLNGVGGVLSMTSGDGTTSGAIQINVGTASDGAAGNIDILGGTGTFGSNINVRGGNASDGYGGNIQITAGEYTTEEPGNGPGNVTIAAGWHYGTHDGYGNIYLLGNVDISQGSLTIDGSPISGGSGTLTEPTLDEDGYVAIASGEDLTYISGTEGQVLTWTSGAWIAQDTASVLTAPTINEDGYVAIASNGNLEYLSAEDDGYVLTWNDTFKIWEPQAPEVPTLLSVLSSGNSANNTRIIDLADPVDDQDAVTKSWVSQQLAFISEARFIHDKSPVIEDDQTEFELSNIPSDGYDGYTTVMMFLNQLKVELTDYSVSETTVTYTGSETINPGTHDVEFYYPTTSNININNTNNRVAKLHDLTHSPLALFQFDGDLTDSSGNGLDLSVRVGTPYYTKILGLPSLYLNGQTELNRGIRDASLAITGAITIEFLLTLSLRNITPTAGLIASFQGLGSAETEATNVLWGAFFGTGTLRMFFESGAGVNREIIGPYIPAQTVHCAITRANNGTSISFYINGELIGSGESATPATGGTDSTTILRIGDGGSSVNFMTGYLTSLKIIGFELSADQVRAEYEHTLGSLYGI